MKKDGYYHIVLKRRRADDLRISFRPDTLENLLAGDAEASAEVRGALQMLKDSGQVWVHDKAHLDIVINNIGKDIKLNELHALMRLSVKLHTYPDDKDVRVRLSQFVADLIAKQIKKLELMRLTPTFSAFLTELMDAIDMEIEREPGEDFTFDIEE